MELTIDAWIDESAGKGYSRNLIEATDHDFALIVALPILSVHADVVRAQLAGPFNAFAAKAPPGVKLHITDALASNDEGWKAAAFRAREDIFSSLLAMSARVVYGARRFALERDTHERLEAVQASSRGAVAKSRPELAFSNHPSKERVEAEAYEQLVLFLDCLGKDEKTTVNPRCDRTDHAIALAYEEKLEFLKHSSSQEHTSRAFDRNKGQLETRSFLMKTSILGMSDDDVNVTHVGPLKVEDSVGPELFAVDVLANSLADHFRHLPSDTPLYGPDASETWRGRDLVWGSNKEGLTAFNHL